MYTTLAHEDCKVYHRLQMPHIEFPSLNDYGYPENYKQTFEKGDSLQKSTGKNTTFRKLKEATEP